MQNKQEDIFTEEQKAALTEVTIGNEIFYKISNVHTMRPFFMTIVSDSNHWMFISSNGGLTAGRKNAEYALFPYYTDDKLTEFADVTGSKTIFQIHHNEQILVWEPFSDRFDNSVTITRNIYKNVYGNKIILEEIFHDLQISFQYQWNSSNLFGFVKKSEIINFSENEYKITLLDGIQNIMPYGVSSDLQTTTSNLVDGYKRNELHAESGLGIFALSAIIVDKAEPSEALKANIAWSLGISSSVYLLSSLQVASFRKLGKLHAETDVKGEKGAYFLSANITLGKNESKKWKIIANVNQNQAQIVQLCQAISIDGNLDKQLDEDIELGTQNLIKLNASADGLQFTADRIKDTRHYSNTLFNIMRGGIFDHNYQLEKQDLATHISKANAECYERNSSFFEKLPEIFSIIDLQVLISQEKDADLMRLCTEYLPLKFSRRHGDPSRPWNKFSINTRSEIDGSKILDYEGNWRDIFQNWEALVHAYPEFIEAMIFKFLNASTFDGYNPYRVTKDGFDWETIEPDNPWSYIGYWGDHQIIYLLKFLEFIEEYKPGKLDTYFDNECFVYAAVPYTIKSYADILKNPKDTISYNHEWEKKISARRKAIGADGTLIEGKENQIYHVNFMEKILATVLAKMSNFIPEAGIWMNTQRPEWNDANNALVGNGVSMVTLYYLRRFFDFFQKLLNNSNKETIQLSAEMVAFYQEVKACLEEQSHLLSGPISNQSRKIVLDKLGKAASAYRFQIYNKGFAGEKSSLSIAGLKSFVQVCLDFITHSIHANQRADKLYHAYNLISVEENEVVVAHLSEMLEGQVAVISSGCLSGNETREILDALRKSALYRADQNSYILYPNKELPKFLEKNIIPANKVKQSKLLAQLLQDYNFQIINQDVKGDYHFNGNFNNANDLKEALQTLKDNASYKDLIEVETELLLQIFEDVFNHKAFTGRSGTFFAFEGLGSIYWHMVSKLYLAVEEACIKAIKEGEDAEIVDALVSHFEEIGKGIGTHKLPSLYGAFPTDPYSHTPQHKGAQQPGMTGQVKEDVLVRIAELGVEVKQGKLCFNPTILNANEFLNKPGEAHFVDVQGSQKTVSLAPGSLAFSFCQVPIVYTMADATQIEAIYADGKKDLFYTPELSDSISKKIFLRTGEITQLNISIAKNQLR